MKNCKACGKEIAKNVKKCVHCGKDQRNFLMRHKFLTGILAIIIIGVAVGVNDDDTPIAKDDSELEVEAKGESKKGEDKESKKTEFKLGEVISYKDFDLEFKNSRKVDSMGTGEYLVIDVVIKSKKDNFTFTGDLQGVTSDDEVIDNTVALTEEDLGDSILTAWTKKLNEGQKASGYIAFDKNLDDIKKIEVRSSLFKNDVINVNIK